MKRNFLFLFILLVTAASAQKYTAEKSYISFFSDATVEDITANTNKASSIFNTATSEIAFSVPIKEFQFAKSLMREHFNEKYMETEKFPKASFQGKFTNFQAQGTGVQNVRAQGKLTIHGVTKDVDVPGTIEIQGQKILMKSKFMVVLEDYQVTRPQLLWQNIAEQVEVTVEFTYKAM